MSCFLLLRVNSCRKIAIALEISQVRSPDFLPNSFLLPIYIRLFRNNQAAKTLIMAIPKDRVQPRTEAMLKGLLTKSPKAVHSNKANNTHAVTTTSG